MIIDDNYILERFLDKNGNPNRARLKRTYLSKDELQYLENRFNEKYCSLSEVVYRIKNKIEELPKCLHCGKELHFRGTVKAFQTYCSQICKNRDTRHNEKMRETFMLKYGVDNPLKSFDIRMKNKQILLEKYGDENFNNREKAERTNIKKFGVNTPLKNRKCIELGRQTCMKKYGVVNYAQTKEHIIATHTPEVNKHRNETRRKNHTFNTSKSEDNSYILLQSYFFDIKRNYSSNVYPFQCDFYIPNLNLYIECNYHWTHGFHPFDENSKEDIKCLSILKERNTKYYNNAIKTWTIRDVNKRNVAIQNKLNYKEFWNYNELETWLSKNFSKISK